MDKKICGITGHRKIPEEYAEQVKRGLLYEIEKAVADGYTCFISGFSDGAELLFAEIVLEKAEKNPALQLEAVLPYRNRYLKLLKDERTKNMLERCAHIEIISENLTSTVYMKRNRFMVNLAERVIAVYDGRDNGGTVSTIRMVHAQRKELREIPVGLQLNR